MATPPAICKTVNRSPNNQADNRAVITGCPNKAGDTNEAGKWPNAWLIAKYPIA